jgi:hypothetical protein
VKEKPAFGSPFFGAFPSGPIFKATKDVSVNFFTHGRYSVNYTRKFRELFEAITRVCVWWAGYGSQYSYRLGGPRIESLRGGRDFPCRPDRRRGLVVTRCIPWVKLAERGADHAYCVPDCEWGGAIPPSQLCPHWHINWMTLTLTHTHIYYTHIHTKIYNPGWSSLTLS